MQKKVLVIEDDSELQELMKIRLEQQGYQVVTASKGDEGVERARSERPDLIILDVFLPHLDGFSALKEIRYGDKSHKNGNALKEVPIIVITGRAPMMEDMFKIEGATEFMVKPLDLKLLAEKISQKIGK